MNPCLAESYADCIQIRIPQCWKARVLVLHVVITGEDVAWLRIYDADQDNETPQLFGSDGVSLEDMRRLCGSSKTHAVLKTRDRSLEGSRCTIIANHMDGVVPKDMLMVVWTCDIHEPVQLVLSKKWFGNKLK